jgi:hypothetical protein
MMRPVDDFMKTERLYLIGANTMLGIHFLDGGGIKGASRGDDIHLNSRAGS